MISIAGESGGTVFRAAVDFGSTKYGEKNRKGVRPGDSRMTAEDWGQLESLYSLGLAKKTWSCYSTAEKMLDKCCEEKGLKRELPLDEDTTLAFIHWLVFTRGVKAATVNSYLAGIRRLHIEKGLGGDHLRTERIKTILKGLKNKNVTDRRRAGEEQRKPITLDILRLLKTRLSESEMSGRDQRMVWVASTTLFHGAFRVHELLCNKQDSFDPDFTLLSQDVSLVNSSGEELLQIKVKAPKESRSGKSVIVDVYGSGTDICPVRAFKKWNAFRLVEEGQPCFRFSSGVPLTGWKFNEIVRERLKGFVESSEKLFSSHSFRAGAASLMAEIGYSEDEIKAVGRWSSRAYMDYIKLPRTNRAEIAKKWVRA